LQNRKETNHVVVVVALVASLFFVSFNWRDSNRPSGALVYFIVYSQNEIYTMGGLSGLDCWPDICQLHLESRLKSVNQLLQWLKGINIAISLSQREQPPQKKDFNEKTRKCYHLKIG
jgi:hypothetical protein